MDADTVDMLRGLGYVGAGSPRRSTGGIDPKDGIELYNKVEQAWAAASRGVWKETERLMREVLAATETNTAAWNLLGESLERQGRLEEAKQAYGQSLATDPKQYKVYASLAGIEFGAGNYGEAEKLYRKVLSLTPDYVEAMDCLRFIERQRGNEADARAWLEKALEVNPSVPLAHCRYADLHFLRGNYAEALKYYRQALEDMPHHFAAMIQGGICAKRLNDYQTAVGYYQSAERLRPDSWLPSYNLACIQALTGDAEGALARLHAAVGKGFRDAGTLVGDPDLESVRRLPGFASLLREVQRRQTGRPANSG
jgi:Flp pilus assembly protein TadD